jgi:hypothetical protein
VIKLENNLKVQGILIGAALGVVILAAPAGAACHHYSRWSYPWPQRCGPTYHAPDKNWYVQVVAHPASAPSAAVAADQPRPAISETPDQRTTTQIQEAKEHDAAVAKHHDEINALMKLLHGETQ